MASSLELALLVGAVVTGLIWLLDALVLRRLRARDKDAPPAPEPWLVSNARSFFPVLLVVLLLRSFLFEPFRIPSGSMLPSLLVGDFIFVNKFDYGLRVPVSNNVFLPLGKPQRGDVIVFHYPEQEALAYCSQNPVCAGTGGMAEVRKSAGEDYIKRVVGVPGDTIRSAANNQLYVNGQLVQRKLVAADAGSADGERTQLHEEWLPRADGKMVHNNILLAPGVPYPIGTWTVPKGEYFVMGDNRDNSFDSRYWGFVPARNLVGKAFIVWFNYSDGHVQWRRIGKTVPQ